MIIDDLSSISEEERSLFRPFTRESLVVIQGRIAEERRKFKELERKRAEGEVVSIQKYLLIHFLISYQIWCVCVKTVFIYNYSVNVLRYLLCTTSTTTNVN